MLIQTTYEQGQFYAEISAEATIHTKTRGHKLTLEEVTIDSVHVTELWFDTMGRARKVNEVALDKAAGLLDLDAMIETLLTDCGDDIQEAFADDCACYGEYLNDQARDC